MDQQALLDQLTALLPHFKEHWEDEDNYYISDRGTFNLHNVCSALSHFYIDNADGIEDDVQQSLFSLLEESFGADSESAATISESFIDRIAHTEMGEKAAAFMGPQCKAHYDSQQEEQ